MFSKYKQFMDKYISFSFIEWKLLTSKMKIKNYKKGETIHHMGDICTELLFINSGLARAYMIDENGKDYTWSIFFNDKNSHMTNLFVVDYDSFLNQTESNLSIEALEDCEVVILSYDNVQLLYDKLKHGGNFGRLMSQEAYTYLHRLIIDRQLKSATERFKIFMETTPYLLEKVPQYHIATFLGITPQYLSWLKKEYC